MVTRAGIVDALWDLGAHVARSRRPSQMRPPRPPRLGWPAPPIEGVTPDGDPIRVETGSGARLVAAFLTSSCEGCEVFWQPLAHGSDGQPASDLVVVTPDPTTEDRRAVATLAPPGRTVVMSTASWFDYGVRGSPWFAVVADGAICAEASAHTWAEILALLPAG